MYSKIPTRNPTHIENQNARNNERLRGVDVLSLCANVNLGIALEFKFISYSFNCSYI
jgi:hypothetical protein